MRLVGLGTLASVWLWLVLRSLSVTDFGFQACAVLFLAPLRLQKTRQPLAFRLGLKSFRTTLLLQIYILSLLYMLQRPISISSKCFFMLFSSFFSSCCHSLFSTRSSFSSPTSWSLALFLMPSMCFTSLCSRSKFSASLCSICMCLLHNSAEGSHTSSMSLHRLINSTLFSVFKLSIITFFTCNKKATQRPHRLAYSVFSLVLLLIIFY